MWLKELFWAFLFVCGIPGPEQFEEIEKKTEEFNKHRNFRSMMGIILVVAGVILIVVINGILPLFFLS